MLKLYSIHLCVDLVAVMSIFAVSAYWPWWWTDILRLWLPWRRRGGLPTTRQHTRWIRRDHTAIAQDSHHYRGSHNYQVYAAFYLVKDIALLLVMQSTQPYSSLFSMSRRTNYFRLYLWVTSESLRVLQLDRMSSLVWATFPALELHI